MVELDSLENCCGASHRGFESHSLRFLSERKFSRNWEIANTEGFLVLDIGYYLFALTVCVV